MLQKIEGNLVVQDVKGNPVAMWRRHPEFKKNILYSVKEMSLGDIEKFGSDLYLDNWAEKLEAKIKEE